MFDNYSRNNYNNPQTVNINAVGGTIIKNYRDSFMVRFNMQSAMGEALLCKDPTMIKIIKQHEYGTYGHSWEEKVKEPVDKMFEPQIDKEVEE